MASPPRRPGSAWGCEGREVEPALTSTSPPPAGDQPRGKDAPEPKVLFLFLDGVGVGSANPDENPFLRAALPCLRDLLGGGIPTLEAPEVHRSGGVPRDKGRPSKGGPALAAGSAGHGPPEAVAFPLDSLLGVPGLPQSGTGQVALFTGINAPRLHGRHFGPWVPVGLRPLLEAENILSRAQALGFSCAFANAYPREFETSPWARRPAGPPLMARAAGLMVRHQEALAIGDALSSEIVNTAWRDRLGLADLPDITPADAGRVLARIASRYRLTFFAHYGTDHAGHVGSMEASLAALERVDDFLGGLLPDLPLGTLLVVASDHGNIEALGKSHTLNPALTLLAGPGALALRRGLEAITDLPAAVLGYLSRPG